jgi:hypothetical protein
VEAKRPAQKRYDLPTWWPLVEKWFGHDR